MICPLCTIDQQRIRLDQHLREDHHWPADQAATYYQQQIEKLREEMK